MADHDPDPDARTTAPQSSFTMREVGIGAVVTIVGLAVVFLLPLLLA